MGTRADFYMGRGEEANWYASIAWDGYPDGIDAAVLEATTVPEYRDALAAFLKTRDDVTYPEAGWPWPWETSHTTDFAYAYDEGRVYASCFGHEWQVATEWDDDADDEGKAAVFPNMKDRQKVTFGKRSGIMVVTERGILKEED